MAVDFLHQVIKGVLDRNFVWVVLSEHPKELWVVQDSRSFNKPDSVVKLGKLARQHLDFVQGDLTLIWILLYLVELVAHKQNVQLVGIRVLLQRLEPEPQIVK